MASRKLPSLNAMRCFEAAARHGSIRRAADELSLTHGAVSHQVKLLENGLSLQLFERVGRRLRLTPAGTKLGNALTQGLDSMAYTLRELDDYRGLSSADRHFRIVVTPSFGENWLLPRIFQFIERHPGFEFSLVASNLDPQNPWDDIDVAIQYGGTDWGSGRWWGTLRQVNLRPVCSPRLFNGKHPIRSLRDLSEHRLLHEDDGSEWARWLRMAGAPQGRESVYFGSVNLALSAARGGHGLALVSSTLSENDERSGQLIVPFDAKSAISGQKAYVCVCDHVKLQKPIVASFIEWVQIAMGQNALPHENTATTDAAMDSVE
ncbi:LysR family transcriptional regulator [Mesorhizobium sp. M6A.T.Cr.TU.016.01.1.1]|nr:LysR family transcriptional regulator [Mesorhizobium sp. M6A.T.Cr.TU.016.01.1.1]